MRNDSDAATLKFTTRMRFREARARRIMFVSALRMSLEASRVSGTMRLKATIWGEKSTRVWRGMARFQKFPGWYNMQGLHSQ